MSLSFTVLGTAAPQGSFKAIVSKSTGRAFLKQSSARTMPWRQEVAGAAERARRSSSEEWPTNGPVELRATFYLPRPAGHLGKKGVRPSAPKYPATKPDLSKLVRAIEDALTGIVYVDDARIVRHVIYKRYADLGVSPRAEIEIVPA